VKLKIAPKAFAITFRPNLTTVPDLSGIFIATWMINLMCLRLWNPELIERRLRFTNFTKTWDKVWAVLFASA